MIFWKCVLIHYFFETAVDLANKYVQKSKKPYIWSFHWHGAQSPSHSDLEYLKAKFKILLDGYRNMLDQLFVNSKVLDDMLRFLPGVVVQHHMGMQGMASLYGIKSDLLKRVIKFTIEPQKLSPSQYKLDDYLSGFLQDRDRSRLYYCDPMLQHVSICRRILFLLGESNPFPLADDPQS